MFGWLVGWLVGIQDNTYSRLVSKFITYSVQVVKKADFAQAIELARDAQKQRGDSARQREYLRSVLGSLAKAVLGTAGVDGISGHSGLAPTSSSEDFAAVGSRSGSGSAGDGSSGGINAPSSAAIPTTNSSGERDEELARLRDEKKSLQIALMTSESALTEERAMWAKSSDRLDTVLTSKESLEDEIQQLTDELEVARTQLEARVRQEEAHVQQNKDFHELQQQFNALQQAREESRTELETLKAGTLGTLESSLAKQKSEKKQLKAYALQLKADMERVTLERDTAAHEKEMAQIAGSNWKSRVDELELELEELRSRVPTDPEPAGTLAQGAVADAGQDRCRETSAGDSISTPIPGAPTDASETYMSPRIMIIGNEDEADEPDEDSDPMYCPPNRTIDSSSSTTSSSDPSQQFQRQQQHNINVPAEVEDVPVLAYTNEQFEEDVENMADTLVKEFQEIKEKTMSIFPSWENILGDEEEFSSTDSGQNADNSNVFGF